ncbi:formate dehydrogenase subunit delta [Bradyrhizobium sp. AZCC 1614]|uniref:formate dehydrogenase subunit delta n=1 Tax=Bradyrhizobium sp. AZCC 1614 TaxID=3117017 RepID=UPI003FA53548
MQYNVDRARSPAHRDVAEHIKKFWDPGMPKAIFAHLDSGGTGREANVRDALEALKKA